MEKKIPKNIRQIGNVSDNPKIYVEDYVDIYFEQLREKVQEAPIGAFLIGEILRQDEQEFVFVNGAIEIQEMKLEGKEIVIGEKAWKKGCEECKRFFEGKIILGWFLIAPGLPLQMNYNLLRIHEKLFAKKSRLFIQKDVDEKEEQYYMYKYNDLMQISGHYIYYEKNADMQDYMIAKRRDNGVTPSEVYEDTAAKSFRSTINKKGKDKKKSKGKISLSYAVSVLLVLVVVAIGITYLNDYDNLQVISTAITETINDRFGELEKEQGQNVDKTTSLEIEVKENEDEVEELAQVQNETSVENIEGEMSVDVLKDDMPQGDESVESDKVMQAEGLGEQAENEDKPTVYVVKRGDTLVKISKAFYTDASRVDDICAKNGLDINDYIYAGQELLLP